MRNKPMIEIHNKFSIFTEKLMHSFLTWLGTTITINT